MERAPIAARNAGKLWHTKVRIDCDSDPKIIYRLKKYPRQHQASDTTQTLGAVTQDQWLAVSPGCPLSLQGANSAFLASVSSPESGDNKGVDLTELHEIASIWHREQRRWE